MKLAFDYHSKLRPSEAYPIGPARARRLALDAEIEFPIEERVQGCVAAYGIRWLLKMLTPEQVAEARRALAGAEDEIGNLTGEPDRPSRAAMDAARRLIPSLANIVIGDDSYASHQRGRGLSASASTEANLTRAKEIAPGLANIKIGAI